MMYRCKYCGRLMKVKYPHKCSTGFRKHKLQWIEVEDEEKKVTV